MTLPFPRSAPGPSLGFAVTGADHDPCSVGPTLRLHTTITESTGTRVHALALRAQVRLEPSGRRYGREQQRRLVELFGEPARWGRTLVPMQLATVSTVTPGFDAEHATVLEIPLTSDTEVAATRYFRGVAGPDVDADTGAGEIAPLRLLFSGTVFYEAPGGVQIGLIPWHSEATFGLPITTWTAMMAAHHGGETWLRVGPRTLAGLSAWRAARALPTWEQTFDALLAAAGSADT